MKKIFTLLLAGIATFGVASAQSKTFDGPRYGNVAGNRNMQREIQKINREYDYKITAVKMNRRMNGWEKQRAVRNLEMQRDREITSLQYAVNNSHNRYDDNRYDDSHSHRW